MKTELLRDKDWDLFITKNEMETGVEGEVKSMLDSLLEIPTSQFRVSFTIGLESYDEEEKKKIMKEFEDCGFLSTRTGINSKGRIHTITYDGDIDAIRTFVWTK